jgi:putative membrane protein insertion efficiency factor
MKRVLLWCIQFFRRCISPNKRGGPCCRYIPTCSKYAITAIERYGAWKGGLMALWRVLRCNPFSKAVTTPCPKIPTSS